MIGKFDFIKVENFYFSIDTLKQVTGQVIDLSV